MKAQELLTILNEGENAQVEFKSEFPQQAHEIAKEMVALANTGGGILIMGVQDDGTPLGITEPKKAEERLTGMASACDPPIRLETNRIKMGDKITVVFAKIPNNPICTYKEKVYIRVGTISRPARGKEIEELCQGLKEINHTQLVRNKSEATVISKRILRKKAWRGYAIGTIFSAAVIYSLLKFFTLSTLHLLIFFLVFGIPASIYGYRYGDTMFLYHRRPRELGVANYVGRGRLMEDDGDGSYFLYLPTADCIYPYCNEGKIVIESAPLREISRLGKSYVGICSVAGKDHSYHLDNILVATPERFDWRPLRRS